MTNIAASDPACGFKVALFGKLPAHGDFVARGLSAARRDTIDRWLATMLHACRSTLDEQEFGERYDAAPPWRFVLPTIDAADRASVGPAAGALAPSIDSAGRRFPIYLALVGLVDDHAEAGAETCENLLYDALEGGWDADALATAAANAVVAARDDVIGTVDERCGARWWTVGNEFFAPHRLAGELPPTLFEILLRPQGDAA